MTFLVLGVTLSVFAKKVEIDQARQVGRNFYYERINLHQQVAFEDILISDAFSVAENDLSLYYIFNIGTSGYILVSADDNLYPVIGYSFETDWPKEELPAHLRFWMDGISQSIKEVLAKGSPADATIGSAWERYRSSVPVSLPDEMMLDVEPLITDIWDQDFPYNAMCPQDAGSGGSYNGRVPVGCVATAMSQIMHYWRHPLTGTGSHCIVPQQNEYGQQCANFGNTTYEWNGITDNPTTECDPVAVLAWHCGISVDMQYGPGGSGTYTYKVANALETYFKYSTSATYLERGNYSTAQWTNLVKTELDAGRPVEYSGSGSGGGHAWVCDGYQGTDYFHMNWGWGGAYNGYFYLNNLNPGGTTFNSNQAGVFQIQPNSSYYPPYCSGQTELVTYDYGSFDDGSGPLAEYQSNANCSWLIEPEDGVETIGINFLNFDLGSGDEVNVYDGNSSSSSLIGTYTGSTLPPEITSTGPALFVTFTTNSTSGGQGFLAEYDCNLLNFCESSVTLLDPTGDIGDGSGDYLYRNSTMCKWYIKPTDAATVILDFNNINTEQTNDKIQVYDLGSGTLLGTYSGDVPNPPTGIVANSGQMLVMWSSNKTIRGEGWDASYTITVGTQEPEAVNNLRVYPNPVTDILNVRFDVIGFNTVQTDLFSLTGKNIYNDITKGSNGRVEKRIDLSGVAKGVYMLRITSETGVSNTKVIVR